MNSIRRIFSKKRYEPLEEKLKEIEKSINHRILYINLLSLFGTATGFFYYLYVWYEWNESVIYYKPNLMMLVIYGVIALLYIVYWILCHTILEKHQKLRCLIYLFIALFFGCCFNITTTGARMIYFAVPIVIAMVYDNVRLMAGISGLTVVAAYITNLIADILMINPETGVYSVDGVSYTIPRLIIANFLDLFPLIFVIIIGFVLTVANTEMLLRKLESDRKREEEKQKSIAVEKELEIARQIQQGMLPQPIGENDALRIISDMVSAKVVGGDFYDYFILKDRYLVVTIGDVSGKGIAASLFASNVKAMIHAYIGEQAKMRPDEILQVVNNELCSINPYKMFVTVFLAMIDLATGTGTYANAGHNPPYIRRKDGTAERIHAKPDFVLGRRAHRDYSSHHFSLNKGETLFLYTDGVTEQNNVAGEMYGEDRLAAFIAGHPVTETFLTDLKEELIQHRQDALLADDTSLVCVTWLESRENSDSIRVYEAGKEAYPDLRDYILTFARKHTEDAAILRDLEIAVGEIFSNLSFYSARKPGRKTRVTVHLLYTKENLSIEFRDNGKPFNPLNRERPSLAENRRNHVQGGFGIYMVRKLMDDVLYSYENGENVLTIVKCIDMKKKEEPSYDD